MKLVSSRKIFSNALISVSVDKALDPEGIEITRVVVHHNGSAVVMPRDARGRILLVRQYRLPARRYVWELPAGKVDEGETPLKAAKRELREETGLTARRWRRLASFYPSPGFLAEKMNIYLAEDLAQGAATPMDDERLRRRWFTIAEIENGIRRGRIVDGKTIIGLSVWRLRQPVRRAGR